MVRFPSSSAWLCSIALFTSTISLPDRVTAQITAPSSQATLATAKQQYRRADFGGRSPPTSKSCLLELQRTR
ncbi:MAG: hypothetical protein HC860_01520 [Alkalinema sp. RU_4_3]|nr:hypothetical protein [Alkalinema sp. RU_4_3]